MIITVIALMPFVYGCDKSQREIGSEPILPQKGILPLDNVAKLLSCLPMETGHFTEVFDAVSSSTENGYDEEYMMRDLFKSPGAGVGSSPKNMKSEEYNRPLRSLISEYLSNTKSGSINEITEGMTPREYLDALENSDIQIYWPYYESWDGVRSPVITFDPGNGSDVNVGYIMNFSDSSQDIQEVIVDEEMAESRPVWVVNRNDDSDFKTIEMLRKENPEWGTGGGSVVIRPGAFSDNIPDLQPQSKVKSLVIKDFKMLRNYDSWFAGASEFFIKCASVEDFSASTEAELKLYSPQVTDFMLVVKRRQVGQVIPLNVMLVSQWTDQLENMAFMLTEDDGGTRTDWKCSAVVKIKSKSYGFEVSLPFNSRDDIVWRGQLGANYLEKYDGRTGRFGDTELTFSFMEK